jgi:hypothetical protein
MYDKYFCTTLFKLLKQSWKYKESIESSHEYVVGVKPFYQCVSITELIA